MPICSYLAVPLAGEAERLSTRLGALPGCEVIRATNRDVMVLITETSGGEEEATLRSEIETTEGLAALVLTFGEIDADAPGVRA
jgi:nitrate reductase NapAB chaperone NapD